MGPRIGGNSAKLSIDNKTVTYEYSKTIRNAYSYPLLQAYIGKQNTWSSETLQTSNWKSLGTACNRNHLIYPREQEQTDTTTTHLSTASIVTTPTSAVTTSCDVATKHAQPGDKISSGKSVREEKSGKPTLFYSTF